jgi:hypothetical protein
MATNLGTYGSVIDVDGDDECPIPQRPEASGLLTIRRPAHRRSARG